MTFHWRKNCLPKEEWSVIDDALCKVACNIWICRTSDMNGVVSKNVHVDIDAENLKYYLSLINDFADSLSRREE